MWGLLLNALTKAKTIASGAKNVAAAVGKWGTKNNTNKEAAIEALEALKNIGKAAGTKATNAGKATVEASKTAGNWLKDTGGIGLGIGSEVAAQGLEHLTDDFKGKDTILSALNSLALLAGGYGVAKKMDHPVVANAIARLGGVSALTGAGIGGIGNAVNDDISGMYKKTMDTFEQASLTGMAKVGRPISAAETYRELLGNVLQDGERFLSSSSRRNAYYKMRSALSIDSPVTGWMAGGQLAPNVNERTRSLVAGKNPRGNITEDSSYMRFSQQMYSLAKDNKFNPDVQFDYNELTKDERKVFNVLLRNMDDNGIRSVYESSKQSSPSFYKAFVNSGLASKIEGTPFNETDANQENSGMNAALQQQQQ